MERETRSTGDGELARRARAGDLGAFDELVRRHEDAAIRVAAVVGGSQGAEDAAQEGFVRAFRALDRFDTDRDFRPWLLRIVANAAKNRVRSDRRHQELHARHISLRDDVHGLDDASDQVVAAERREAVASAVARLPVADRTVIAYRWFEGLSERDMATALGLRPGTVKSRLSRAMARLREELERSEVTVD